jgi:hypothetical protein
MGERSGPFWDGVEGRAPMPPAAATLGDGDAVVASATATARVIPLRQAPAAA